MIMVDGPARLDFTARQGDTFRKPIVFGGTGFDPTDLTGFTARMDVRDVDTGELLHTFTTDDGSIIMGNTDLTITLLMTDTETREALWDVGEYDFELKDSIGSGDVATYLFGAFCITPETTLTET